jgi:hypothetical protein
MEKKCENESERKERKRTVSGVGDDGGGYYRREGKSRSEGERGFVCCLVAARNK